MDIISISGENFEYGKVLGKKFAKAIGFRLKNLNIDADMYATSRSSLDTLYHNCMKTFPELIDEIKGISVGSGHELNLIFCLNLLELPDIGRCSTIISREKEILIAHNEDGHPFEEKKDFAIIKRDINGLVIHSFNYPGELSGSSFEWNSSGLIVSVNNLGIEKINLRGLPRTFIARKVIEQKSIEGAIDVIRENECASGFHYTIGQKDRVVSVEQHHKKVSVIEISKEYYHTNHYLRNFFTSDLIISENSKVRHQRITELIDKKKDTLSILFDTKNKPNAIYGDKKNESQTMATFMAYPMRNLIRIYSSDDRKKFLEVKIN